MVWALIYRAKAVCSTPETLVKEMDYLHCVFLKNSYPEWLIKEPEKKPSTPIINPETGLKISNRVLIYVPYVPCLSEEFRRIFHYTEVQAIFTSNNTLKSILMQSKDNVPHYILRKI